MADLTDQQLHQQRQDIRRGLVRSNTATGVALLITVGLAMTAVFYAFQAERHAEVAQEANRRTTEELWNSQLAHARALRLSAKVGRRRESLQAIDHAVSIRASPELRDEAIAALALVDIRPGSLSRPASPRANAYAFSPTLGLYALGFLDGLVEVMVASNGQSVARFSLSNQPVFSVAFSPDERFIAARWEAGGFEIWDLVKRQRAYGAVFPQREASAHPVGFHPDSRRVAVACADNTVRVIDLDAREATSSFKFENRPWNAAFDPRGERLAVAVGRMVEVLAFPSGQRLSSIDALDTVGRLQWHPEGHLLAAGSPLGRMMLLEVASGRVKVMDAHTQRINNLLFHPNGRLLVSSSWDGTTRFWDGRSARLLLQTQSGFALGFDRAGDRLGFFREGNVFGDWRVDLDPVYSTASVPLSVDEEILAVALSSDARWMAGTTRESLHLWETRTGRHLGSRPWPRTWGVAFTTGDRELFLSCEKGLFRMPLFLVDASRSSLFGEPDLVPGTPVGVYAHGNVTSGKGRYFGAEGVPNHVVVNLASPHTVRTLPGRWENSAPSSADGRLAATSRWKGRGTRIWDLETRKEVKALADEGGVSMFSPDGQRLVVGTSGEFLLYDTQTWEVVRRVARDCPSAISGLMAFTADGSLLAVTYSLRQVRLLRPQTGETLATLDAPAPERITTLCFSDDGSLLAAGTDHADIQLWDVRSLRGRLKAMSLDWDETSSISPTLPVPERSKTAAEFPAMTAPRRFPRSGAIWVSGTGALLALVFAVLSVRHHRRLVEAYTAADNMAIARRKELDLAQTQLLHSHKMRALGTLAAGIAHDFNNLLSIIRMSGQLVRRQVQPTGLTRENLDSIDHAVAQGKDIVRSILGYSRQPSDPTAMYSVNTAVSETITMLSKQFLSGIVLTLELEKESPTVRGDRNRLEQILLNLIVNAAEAMNGKGRLLLQVRLVNSVAGCVLPPRTAPRYIELIVRDSGPGIPPEVLPRIFEPFFTTKRDGTQHGTGLGLTTVYTIAQQDGLGLGVESSPDKGAAFRVFVPVEEPPREGKT